MIRWYYSTALRNLFKIWRDFVWFFYHFFSIGVLFRTLFSPWRRLDEGYKKGLELEAWFETFIVNSLMRVVGAMMRMLFIIIGLVALILITISIVPLILAWIIFPFVLLALFIIGLRFLI